MYNLMKLTILILAVISLTACLGGTRTKYRSGPATTDTVTAAERDRIRAERDALQEERDALKIDFGDDFSAPTTTSVALAAVTRVARNTGQEITFRDTFNAHYLAGPWVQNDYNINTPGMRNSDALAIRTDAQLYPRDGGNPMLFASTGASTDEFPGRGDVFRAVSYRTTHDDFPGTTTGRLTIQGSPMQATNWRDWENPVLTSFQFTRGGDNPGMVMNFGADENGGAVFNDLETYGERTCSTSRRNCHADSSHDISIGFGANRHRNPAEGALAYYWRALVPNHHNDRDREVIEPGDSVSNMETPPTAYTATEDVGTYTLELTHAATGLEDAADADADTRYLSYAAYGLFNFFDKYRDPARSNAAGLSRMQTISYGLDAFADAEGMRTTEPGTNITATFKGRTIAYLLHLNSSSGTRRLVEQLTRMRGDISLTASIGPATNTITGAIGNLEYHTSDAGQSSWRNSDITTGANTNEFSFATVFGADGATLNLTGGTIEANGSYEGTVTPSVTNTTFNDGEFKGNLYGPLDGLETAGTWWLPAQDAPANIGVAGIIGSFGACQDGKGRC